MSGNLHRFTCNVPKTCISGAAPVFYPLCGTYHEMQGFGGSTYRPSYRHPGVATCSLGNPGPILGSAATGTARSAVGGPFQTFLAEHRARATGVTACSTVQTNCCSTTVQRERRETTHGGGRGRGVRPNAPAAAASPPRRKASEAPAARFRGKRSYASAFLSLCSHRCCVS